jgi:3',5'-cyclic AMP phosphodiesterase CpdA
MIFFCAFFLNCGSTGFEYQKNPQVKSLIKVKSAYPDTRFIILSDPHYYEPGLGTDGRAFQAYLDKDRKMLKESSEIFAVATNQISRMDADFMIVCGDLTKDGELLSHQAVAAHLKKVTDSGKQVFVIPGNHDVANGESFAYRGNEVLDVPNVSGAEFESIYRTYGFDAAIERDPSSLSYVAEPVPGLWLLALDSCRWKENRKHHESITEGRFSAQTLNWMEDVLIKSKKAHKALIATLHHGIWEHYPGNEKHYAKYLVEDFEEPARMLAAYGVSLIFTGHFHAQDITMAKFQESDRFLFDIETGSLVTFPCPFRVVTISDGHTATVTSRFINSIPSQADFRQYARDYCLEKSILLVNAALKKYRVSTRDIDRVNRQVAAALMTHLAGDEKKPLTPLTADGMNLWGKLIFSMRKDLLDGWYTDLYPADNQVTIDLKTGRVR